MTESSASQAHAVAATVRAFFEAYPVKTYSKGEILVQAEETPPGVFYITKGRVNQYDIAPAGTDVVVNIFKPGAFFPMSWAMNRTANHYFFEAATSTTAHLAPADKATDFLKANPPVLYDLLSRVYRGVDGLLRRTAHLMGGDAHSRLVFELLNAAYRFGQPQPDGSLWVPLQEGDIAKQAGMARETVNRTIRQLKQDGTIVVRRDGYVLRDVAALEAVLGHDL